MHPDGLTCCYALARGFHSFSAVTVVLESIHADPVLAKLGERLHSAAIRTPAGCAPRDDLGVVRKGDGAEEAAWELRVLTRSGIAEPRTAADTASLASSPWQLR
jgi:hypothetical protein